VRVVKIGEVAKRHRHPYLSELKAKVLAYLEQHPDEVFTYRDQALAKEVGAKPSAVAWTLWWLHRQGLIARAEVDARVYFGTRGAIAALRRRLGVTADDVMAQVDELRERIRARVGNIDVVALLDEVRGPWE